MVRAPRPTMAHKTHRWVLRWQNNILYTHTHIVLLGQRTNIHHSLILSREYRTYIVVNEQSTSHWTLAWISRALRATDLCRVRARLFKG